MLPTVSSREILRLVEGSGLSGSWSWTFDVNEHYWSPGLRRILGVSPDVSPDFGMLQSLVHPEDRPSLRPSYDVVQVGVVPEETFRILRLDGSIRTVVSHGETFHSPSGRPLRVMGVLVDVSAREEMARAKAAQRRRNRIIFETLGAFTSTTTTYPYTNFSDEILELVGMPKSELIEEPTICVSKDERQRWKESGHSQFVSGRIVHTLPRLILASGEVVPYRMVMVPSRDAAGVIRSWSNFVTPIHLRVSTPHEIADVLEEHIQGMHVRAGRALLGWSMSDLSGASGLSLSTVRRLEDEAGGRTPKTARACVAALRRHGVRFSLDDEGHVILGKR